MTTPKGVSDSYEVNPDKILQKSKIFVDSASKAEFGFNNLSNLFPIPITHQSYKTNDGYRTQRHDNSSNYWR